MAYVSPNFKTKKALKEALAAGKLVEVYQAGLGTVPFDGRIALEGPHSPEPHKWYANGTMLAGKLVKIATIVFVLACTTIGVASAYNCPERYHSDGRGYCVPNQQSK